VYSALEALDKDYIHAILISIKATEKTSKGIQFTQNQIKKIVDDQKKTLEVLKKFKQKLDSYAHLGDIDKIWNDYQKWYENSTSLENSINNVISTSIANTKEIDGVKTALETTDDKIANFEKCLKQQMVKIESIFAFICELEKIVHLHNIDEMWNSNEVHSSQLSKLEKQSEETTNLIHNNNKINEVAIADAVEKNEVHSGQLSKLEKKSEETTNLIHNNNKISEVAIADVIVKNDIAVQLLTKKIKYAYLLTGGTLGLALVELAIILFKVI
ncbi:MAG: hypothetical protein WA898_05955, partial [Carnobacterium jeotgali]